MTTADHSDATKPAPSPDDPAASASLDPDNPGDPNDPGDHGRVGYGGYAKYTPLALALLMIAGLLALGIYRYGPGDEAPDPASRAGNLLGAPAPDVTLTLLDGSTLRLADLRGQVVVLNFWATWCEPCKEEMPLFQTFAEAGNADGIPIAILGVGVKARDTPDAIRGFIQDLGITYPIAHDGGGDSPLVGPVEAAFGKADFLPLTFIITPDGVVSHVQVGPYRDPADLTAHVTAAGR